MDTKKNKETYSMRIDADLFLRLKEMAKEDNRPLCNYIETLLLEFVRVKDHL